MEVGRVSLVDFDTARRCLQAAKGKDDQTRRSLERAAARYFWKACGMDRPEWDAADSRGAQQLPAAREIRTR